MSIQVDGLRGPLIWDLGHCAWFEELWVLRNAFHEPAVSPETDVIYDNERYHKRTRQTMRLLGGDALFTYMQAIRQRVLQRLEETVFPDDHPLLRGGFVFDLVLNHEMQHREIMIITLQQLLSFPLPAMQNSRTGVASAANQQDRSNYRPGMMIEIPAGEFLMGADHHDFAYDNERPAHRVFVPTFAIDKFLTSNGEYLEFIEAGGYQRREFWSDAGWNWIKTEQIVSPDYWRFDPQEGWVRKNFGGEIRPLDADEPVCNVSWHEAEAYAHFRGKRLPTEQEWEKAAAWNANRGTAQLYPWGQSPIGPERASTDARLWGPCKVWELPGGDSPYGVRQMLGNVFEWTSSPFLPYDGFQAHPYKEYSQIFMNPRFKVLRGASWATAANAIRNSYRNFYLPEHRNVIAGIRLARDL
jgi:iron(II)-dependent oxidoreductase